MFVDRPLPLPRSSKKTLYFLWIREELLEIPFSPSYALELLGLKNNCQSVQKKLISSCFFIFICLPSEAKLLHTLQNILQLEETNAR